MGDVTHFKEGSVGRGASLGFFEGEDGPAPPCGELGRRVFLFKRVGVLLMGAVSLFNETGGFLLVGFLV